MRDLFTQDRPLSPALIRTGTTLLALLLAGFAVLVVFMALGALAGGHVLAGLIQLVAGLSAALFAHLTVRLLSELLMAAHRLNDRLTVLGDELRASAQPKDD